MANGSTRTMQIFGVPYQFMESVDPRVSDISTTVGAHFTKNILYDAPFVTIIPGEPAYLRAGNNQSIVNKFINAASLGTVGKSSEDNLRFYDFKGNYFEYMKYVNNLCRACAVLLGIGDRTFGNSTTALKNYDWRNYHWNGRGYLNADTTYGSSGLTAAAINQIASRAQTAVAGLGSSATAVMNSVITTLNNAVNTGGTINMDTGVQTDADGNVTSVNGADSTSMQFTYETENADGYKSTGDSLTDAYINSNCLQIYIDPDSAVSEQMSNQTGESMIKSQILDNSSSLFKELSFITNSAGVGEPQSELAENIANLTKSGLDSLTANLGSSSTGTNIATAAGRALNLLSNCVNGETVVMPDIYQSSEFDRSFSFNVHLKSPYGTPLGYFLDIVVPLMHLIALVLPRQATANSYKAPFLVKAYIDGEYSVNLGIVSSIQINKGSSDPTFTADGFPTEVDITVNIADLYSDLMITASTNPVLFMENGSLIEYLSMTCGLGLYTPNVGAKVAMFTNAAGNAVTDTLSAPVGKAITFLSEHAMAWSTLGV